MDRLDAFQAFVRTVDSGSFTEAAEEMQVSQPTISRWMQELEEEFGAQLLNRTTRSLEVTDAGQLLYEQAQEILARYQDLSTRLSETSDVLTGTLRVSIPVVFGRRHVLPLLSEFMNLHPRLNLDISMSDQYVNLVEEGFDLAVRVGVSRDSTLRTVKLGTSTRMLVASPLYFTRHRPPKLPKDLASHECLTYRGTENVWVFNKEGKSVRVSARGPVASNNTDVLLHMAKQGKGLALLASWLVAKEIELGTLRAVMSDWTLPLGPVQALLPPGKYTSPRTRALIAFLQEHLCLPGQRGQQAP